MSCSAPGHSRGEAAGEQASRRGFAGSLSEMAYTQVDYKILQLQPHTSRKLSTGRLELELYPAAGVKGQLALGPFAELQASKIHSRCNVIHPLQLTLCEAVATLLIAVRHEVTDARLQFSATGELGQFRSSAT